jgi:hypothetical protein
LLAVSSYLTVTGFGLGFPFVTSTPSEGSIPVYPWSTGLFFSGLTAFIFLLCIDDSQQRRSAFAAFGISALLTGPAYVWNGESLARFAPESSTGIFPHLPFGLTVLCWGSSAALFIWWLWRSSPLPNDNIRGALLFYGLSLVLLVVPCVANLCGVESMRLVFEMPMSADAHRQTNDTLTHFLVQREAGLVGDLSGFLVQWIGVAISAFVLVFAGVALWTERYQGETPRSRARPFPNRADLPTLLLLFMGELLFPPVSSMMGNLPQEFKEIEHTTGRSIYSYHIGFFTVQILIGFFFLASSWLLLRRIQTASQLRFGFTLLILIGSALLAISAIIAAPHALKVGGVLAFILCLVQITVFFQSKRRAVWVSSTFAAPSETALNFVIQGSIMLAVLASAFMAVAIDLAFISVFGIKYFIEWGTALKPLHGVAPIEKIVPEMAPGLAPITIALGPVYFAVCVFISAASVLIFSLVYSGGRRCATVYSYAIAAKRSRAVASSDAPFIERNLGEVRM